MGAGGQSQLYGVVTEFIYPSTACNFKVQNRAKIVNWWSLERCIIDNIWNFLVASKHIVVTFSVWFILLLVISQGHYLSYNLEFSPM